MIVKDDENKDEKAKKEPIIDFNIEKFLKDNNIYECMKKLVNQDLLDPKMFFTVDIGTLESTLDIKPEGRKHKVMKKIKELREKFEKEGAICYIDPGLLEEKDGLSLKFARSQTFAKTQKSE